MPESGRAVSNHTMYVFAKEKHLRELLRSGRITQEQCEQMEQFLYDRFEIASIEDHFDTMLLLQHLTQPKSEPAQEVESVSEHAPVTTAESSTPPATTDASDEEYVSLTQFAREYNPENPGKVIQLWLQSQNTVEFLELWEEAHNPRFNQAACADIQSRLRDNTFTLTAKYWIEQTNGIGLQSKPGRGGGTLAHPVIACEFLTGLSPRFRLSLIEMRQLLGGFTEAGGMNV